MSTLQYKAIDPGRLDAMRDQGVDEFGNPWKQNRLAPATARGGLECLWMAYGMTWMTGPSTKPAMGTAFPPATG